MSGNARDHKARLSLKTLAGLTAALLAAGAVSGCSTNLTGFEFPAFGLLDKDRKEARDSLGPTGAPPQGSRLDIR